MVVRNLKKSKEDWNFLREDNPSQTSLGGQKKRKTDAKKKLSELEKKYIEWIRKL